MTRNLLEFGQRVGKGLGIQLIVVLVFTRFYDA